jgi:hypothetical protein
VRVLGTKVKDGNLRPVDVQLPVHGGKKEVFWLWGWGGREGGRGGWGSDIESTENQSPESDTRPVEVALPVHDAC